MNFKIPRGSFRAGCIFERRQKLLPELKGNNDLFDDAVAKRVEFPEFAPAPEVAPAVPDAVRHDCGHKVGVSGREPFGIGAYRDLVVPARILLHKTQNFLHHLVQGQFHAKRSIEKFGHRPTLHPLCARCQ